MHCTFLDMTGRLLLPFPVHHQIVSSGRPDIDSPRGWPQVLLQFLFASFDRTSFVPTQGSIHDPLSLISLEDISRLQEIALGVDRRGLRNMSSLFSRLRSP